MVNTNRRWLGLFGLPAGKETIKMENLKMKKLSMLFMVAGLAALVATPSALAKKNKGGAAPTPTPSDVYSLYDKNGNGTLEDDEKEAIRAAYAKDPSGLLKQYDTDSDGKLNDAEISAIPATKPTADHEHKHKKNK